MTAVEAARLGHPTRDGIGEIEDHEYVLPWRDRDRVLIDVTDEESLASVIQRAADALGVRPLLLNSDILDLRFVAFNDRDGGLDRRRVIDRLTVVDEAGAATWGVYDFSTIPYGQVVRSTAAGTIPGDPTRLFVVRAWPWAGGGIATNWDLILLVYLLIDRALGTLANTHGTVQFIQMLRDRMRRGREAVATNEPRWMPRGGTPDAVRGMLRDRSAWPSRDAAARLGCTVEEAEGVMPVLGYERNADGEWVWAAGDPVHGIAASDDLCRLTVSITSEAEWDHSDYVDGPPIDEAAVERLVERMLGDYIETGRLPPTRSEEARRPARD